MVQYAAVAALVTIVLVAARDTKADRYVFRAYFLAASAGVVLACARWPLVASWADQLDRMWPWGPAVLWLRWSEAGSRPRAVTVRRALRAPTGTAGSRA